MHRNLSLKGKVLLVNALMASILQYPSSAVSTPVRVLVEYKKIILDFFWNYKWSKVAYNLLIQDIGEGGIKFPDITTRIKTSHLYWIKYLWAKPESLMALVIRHLVGYDDVHQLIESNLDQSSKIPSSYPFIKAIMSTWNKLHSTELKRRKRYKNKRSGVTDTSWYSESLSAGNAGKTLESVILTTSYMMPYHAFSHIRSLERNSESPSLSLSCYRLEQLSHVAGRGLYRVQLKTSSKSPLPSLHNRVTVQL